MAMRTAIVLLFLGLPVTAAALNGPDTAECARLAGKFGAAPRDLALNELDGLKSCINEQQEQMRQASDEQATQARYQPPRHYPLPGELEP